MKTDSIIREELWRSIAVYFISFLAIGALSVRGYLPLPPSSTFLLALIPTALHFLIMVQYRRKERLTDPTITNILRHALRQEENGGKDAQPRRAVIEKIVDAILIGAIFLIYLYASLAYSINQIFWLLALAIISILLMRIVFIDSGEHRVDLARWIIFYLIVSLIILLRHLALGYPVFPILGVLVIVGIGSVVVLNIWEKRCVRKGKD
jgi:hypothetical protein